MKYLFDRDPISWRSGYFGDRLLFIRTNFHFPDVVCYEAAQELNVRNWDGNRFYNFLMNDIRKALDF